MGISFLNRFVISFSAILLVSTLGLMSFSCGCGENKKTAGDISVPIDIRDSKNIGSVDIVFTYDPSVLEITEVLPGELTQNAMMEYNAENPGKVNIGIIDTDGISGDGTLVTIGFNVVNDTGTNQFKLETVKTHDATTLIDVINYATDGIYRAEGNTLEAPIIYFTD